MEDSSFIYYLGLGTNLGNKEQNLRDAVQKFPCPLFTQLSLGDLTLQTVF